jgi:transposase-like protein
MASKRKARKVRKSYSAARRAVILAAAQKEGLTANQVQRQFGVTPVTYYSWRKKAKLAPMPRGRRPSDGASQGLFPGAAQIRDQVRRRVQEIIKDEVGRVLASLR